MRNKQLKGCFSVIFIAAALFCGRAAVAEAGEELRLKKTYITEQQEDDGRSQFEEVFHQEGISYHLKSVESELIEKIFPGDMITYDSPPFVGDSKEYAPAEIVKREEKNYRLLKCSLEPVTTEETLKYSEASVLYEAVEFIDALPESAEVHVTNLDLQQELLVTLPAVAYEEEGTYWDYTFSFPVTVTGYDEDSYMLGQREIPREAPLIDYADEFLEYLNLPGEYYQITSIEWEGEPVRRQGKMIRKASAHGRKLVKDIRGIYGGEVTYPSAAARQYHCIYIEADAENQTEQILYRKEATAVYEPDSREKMNFWDFLKMLLKWLLSHPAALALLLVLLLFVIILMIFARKKKEEKQKGGNQEMEEDKDEED